LRIQIDFSALKEIRWYQLAIRFCCGGLITAATGLIARKYGPAVGGLFLAFPAIFPAGATLIEKHEKEKKQRAGVRGDRRARQVVALDARGAAMGSVGLLTFALLASKLIVHHQPWLVMTACTLTWLATALLIWLIAKRL